MPADRYLKAVLTVIALELGWLAINGASVPLSAQRGPAPQPVVIRGIDLAGANVPNTLPVTLTGNNALVPVTLTSSNTVVRVMTDRPLQIEQPLIVHNDRPLVVETGSRPLLIQSTPATSSARPGPGE
jgi:magnesium-transporting ATPase (P-type)